MSFMKMYRVIQLSLNIQLLRLKLWLTVMDRQRLSENNNKIRGEIFMTK